ncbi:MAG: hypothetical protein NTV70_00155 [Acidobacteria bacterium]|nr:hypothetical protein [Acidobacteriota bacterium]
MRLRLTILAAVALTASAHDLVLTAERTGAAVVIRAAYAGTEPCPFAPTEVFSPAGPKTEHQNGRTDRTGRFAFLPDQPGTWRVVVDDELGHRVEIQVPVTEGANLPLGGAQPVWQKALTGAALILGLTGGWYGWKRRPKPEPR